MIVPNYISEPKPGIKDSIRKWEKIKKVTQKEKKEDIGTFFLSWSEHKCGLCEEAKERIMWNCSDCRFPGKGRWRCCRIIQKAIGAKFARKPRYWRIRESTVTEKDRKFLIKTCDEMLKKLRQAK